MSPEISEIILLWDRIDEKALPISERWFRKIYSFSKVSETLLVSQEVSIRVFLSHFVRFRTMEYDVLKLSVSDAIVSQKGSNGEGK